MKKRDKEIVRIRTDLSHEDYLKQFFPEEAAPMTSLRGNKPPHSESLAERAISRFRETYRQRVRAISS